MITWLPGPTLKDLVNVKDMEYRVLIDHWNLEPPSTLRKQQNTDKSKSHFKLEWNRKIAHIHQMGNSSSRILWIKWETTILDWTLAE